MLFFLNSKDSFLTKVNDVSVLPALPLSYKLIENQTIKK